MAKEKPADLSVTCFQGEAWRVCHLYIDGIPANCQEFCPRGQPDRKAFEFLQSLHSPPDSRHHRHYSILPPLPGVGFSAVLEMMLFL